MIGKSLPPGPGIETFGGFARQALGRLSIPAELVGQHHAASRGAVVGQQAIGHIQHDVALVALACALLHEILDLEHQIIGERAEQAEHRIVAGAERSHEIAHQRHHAGAPRALILLDGGGAAHDMTGKPRRAFFRDDDAGLAQRVAEKGDQNLTARVQRDQRKIDA